MRRIAPALSLGLLVFASCGKGAPDLLRRYDAGSDASLEDAGSDAPLDAPTSDALSGAPCADDPQCNDAIDCTFDQCDLMTHRCLNVPDDTRCDDGVYCNGQEACRVAHGCVAGAVVTCEDGDVCTTKRCIEATKSCDQTPRDLDGDGDPDDHCVPKRDCNDLDPTVSSQHAEVCKNGKDDNCNGVVDEMPCTNAAGDVCATAVAVMAGSTVTLSTVGANKDYASSCSVTMPSAAKDIVAVVTVPPGANKDLDLWTTTQGVEVSVAVRGVCDAAPSELACAAAAGATSVRARARNLAPGDYYVLITTQAESSVVLKTTLLDPTPSATNETCATATPIAIGVATTVSIIDPSKDLASACIAATGELTYALTLPQAADVKIYSSTLVGSGTPVVGLRGPHCIDAVDELRCHATTTLPLFARGLAAGTYVVTVAATSPIDANIVVETSAPTVAPADQTCAAPPPVVVNATMDVDLADHEDAIKDGCLAGGPNAAYDLNLAVASDVLVVGRFPSNDAAAVSLDGLACTMGDNFACAVGTSPVRVGRHNIAPGDYRVVVTDGLGAHATLTTLVRAAIAPTIVVGADTCASAVEIPPDGAFFTGDTSTANADYDNGCDAPNGPPGGAPDQVLRLDLPAPKRVVFDMEGSAYATILDIRLGASCPGQPVDNGCFVGFNPPRSFLDLELPAGQYWIIVDGFASAKGRWNLDVRVLNP